MNPTDRATEAARTAIWQELRGTIPPSIDPMRSHKLERAASEAVKATVRALLPAINATVENADDTNDAVDKLNELFHPLTQPVAIPRPRT